MPAFSLRGAGALRGLFGERGRRRGFRFDGSLDQFCDAMAAVGHAVTYEPLENGILPESTIGAFRTWGSPWTDVQERDPGTVLTRDLARAISEAAAPRI